MQFIAAFLLVLALAQETLGASVSPRSPQSPGLAKCPSAYVVNSSVITVDGNDVQFATYACPDGSLTNTTGSTPMTRAISTDTFTALRARNPSECINPAPECQCGEPSHCACDNKFNPQPPAAVDCSVIISSLRVVEAAFGPTFVVQPGFFEQVSFSTCAFEWTNLDTNPLEYCWDQLIAIEGETIDQCIETAESTGLLCQANNGLWTMDAFRIAT